MNKWGALFLFCCAGAQAYTVDFSLTDMSFQVIDLTPDDGIAPSYTLDPGSNLASFMTAVDYHAASANEPAPPPSSGTPFAILSGTIAPGTALHWTAKADLKISVIDGDNMFDVDRINADFGVGGYPADPAFYSQEIPLSLMGQGGSYQRLVQDSGQVLFDVTLFDPHTSGRPSNFQLEYSLQTDGFQHSDPRPPMPVPEPGTYALLLAGLGVTWSWRRHRLRG